MLFSAEPFRFRWFIDRVPMSDMYVTIAMLVKHGTEATIPRNGNFTHRDFHQVSVESVESVEESRHRRKEKWDSQSPNGLMLFFNTYSIIILYHDKRNNDDMKQ